MHKIYFGVGIDDSMFDSFDEIVIERNFLTFYDVKKMIKDGVTSCCGNSHLAKINALKQRFGIDVSIADTDNMISLGYGDSIIVMKVRGLPRLTDREYTEEEIADAEFSFSLYTIVSFAIVP